MTLQPDLRHPDRILHGCDYNPEQWLECPDILLEDERLMPLAHLNTASIGIFSWSMLEPEEGCFRFDWLDETFDRLARVGASAFLATPSGARPPWMSRAYPEVLRVRPDGGRNLHGSRHNHCLSSPVFRQKTRIINQQLARRYSGRPNLLGWHISNEMGGACYCGLCAEEFRNWLRRRYGNIETLNIAWNTRFWSSVYNDWAEIDPANGYGQWSLHGMRNAWRRFVSDQHIDFYRHEVTTLREAGAHQPCTTNMHSGGCNDIDGWRLGRAVDVVAWDSYPCWGQHAGGEAEAASEASFDFDVMRGLAGQRPFLMMESTTSHVNWHGSNAQKPNGFALTSALQAVAQGSQAVMYFQWRKSIANFEKQHGAIVDHAGQERSRCFRETAVVGEALERLRPVLGAEVASRVGILYDWQNTIAIPEAMGLRNAQFRDKSASYRDAMIGFHRALCACGVTVDIVEPDGDQDWSRYRVLVAPLAYMLSRKACAKLAAFVSGGGHLAGSYWLGQVDEEDRCYLGGFPGGGLKDVFGLWADEWHSMPDHGRIAVSGATGLPGLEASFFCDQVVELLQPEGAEVLASYGDGIYAGSPALCCHTHGHGRAWYQGCHLPAAQQQSWFQMVLTQAEVPALVAAPADVQVGCRQDNQHRYLFLLNFSDQPRRITTGPGHELICNHAIENEVLLSAYGSAVLRQNRNGGI